VSGFPPHLLPDPLLGIEVGRIGRKKKKMQSFYPRQKLLVDLIGSMEANIIQNEPDLFMRVFS